MRFWITAMQVAYIVIKDFLFTINNTDALLILLLHVT